MSVSVYPNSRRFEDGRDYYLPDRTCANQKRRPYGFWCSRCGFVQRDLGEDYNFCPECGARVVEDENV